MKEQVFRSITKSTKKMLVDWAKKHNFKYKVKELTCNCYDVTIYCSAEALERP